jgi:hypothetical protein
VIVLSFGLHTDFYFYHPKFPYCTCLFVRIHGWDMHVTSSITLPGILLNDSGTYDNSCLFYLQKWLPEAKQY